MTADPRSKARNLVRLAVDPAAAENEARTAAVFACRMIHEHGLLDVNQEPEHAPAVRQNNAVPKRIRVRFGDSCRVCHMWIDEGATALWAQGVGLVHLGACEREWRSGAA